VLPKCFQVAQKISNCLRERQKIPLNVLAGRKTASASPKEGTLSPEFMGAVEGNSSLELLVIHGKLQTIIKQSRSWRFYPDSISPVMVQLLANDRTG
jgi:hypothetical protein